MSMFAGAGTPNPTFSEISNKFAQKSLVHGISRSPRSYTFIDCNGKCYQNPQISDTNAFVRTIGRNRRTPTPGRPHGPSLFPPYRVTPRCLVTRCTTCSERQRLVAHRCYRMMMELSCIPVDRETATCDAKPQTSLVPALTSA